MNMLEVTIPKEEVITIARLQAKKASYLDPQTEKERLKEAQMAVEEEQSQNQEATNTH